MALVESAAFTASSRPVRSTTLPADAYVLSIASLPSHYAVLSSSPSNVIYLFDKANLHPISQFNVNGDGIACMRTVPSLAGSYRETLVSCGTDGFVNVWDERATQSQTTPVLQMYAMAAGRKRAYASCDVSANGMTVAAGTVVENDEVFIHYWDPRNPAVPLRTHSSTHSGDITSVNFMRSAHISPGLRDILLSASSDGLVCTSNADEPDEDESVLHVGNWGCSVAQSGWVHGRGGTPGVWASSDMETFSTWSGDLDMVSDIDIRQPSIHRQDMTWVTDYLIGCHNSSAILPERDNDLCIFAGSNEGDIALMTRASYSDPSAPYVLEQTWTTAHVGVVRSVLWDEKNNILLTGGEDSKVNVWSAPPPSAETPTASAKRQNDADAMDVDEEVATTQHRKRRRS